MTQRDLLVGIAAWVLWVAAWAGLGALIGPTGVGEALFIGVDLITSFAWGAAVSTWLLRRVR